jgi:hypothetical protein
VSPFNFGESGFLDIIYGRRNDFSKRAVGTQSFEPGEETRREKGASSFLPPFPLLRRGIELSLHWWYNEQGQVNLNRRMP